MQYLVFTSLYLRCYPIQLLTQNSTISLNLRVSGGGLRCKALQRAVHSPRSQIGFRKYNIMRMLNRNNGERSSPSVNTNHADSTSRLQMCTSIEHRYRTSLVLKIEFPFESILQFVTWCSRHMNLNVKLCFFPFVTSPTYSHVPIYNNSPIPHSAKLLLKIHLLTHLMDSTHTSSGT